LAKEEISSTDNDRKALAEIRKELDSLKQRTLPASSAKDKKGKSRAEDVDYGADNETAGELPLGSSTSTHKVGIKNRENIDPRTLAEVERMIRERDSLIDSGGKATFFYNSVL
jgi:hypothetical protein